MKGERKMPKLLGKNYRVYTGKKDGKEKECYDLYFLTGAKIDEGSACGVAFVGGENPAFAKISDLHVGDEFFMNTNRYGGVDDIAVRKRAEC